jgi:hypothetical protein
MDWARRRQLLYLTGVFAFFALIAVWVWYAFIYAPPSCTDGIQNQNEQGIDCDGVCSNMCTPSRVDALWTRAVKVTDGVYHGIAEVKNPLPTARAKGLEYIMSLYDVGNILIAERKGTVDLDPGQTRSIFEANIITGSRVPVRSFTKFAGGNWSKAEPWVSPIKVLPGTVDQAALMLPATLENTTAAPVTGITADALLYDANDILVAASETKVARMQPRERKDIIFTWAVPFTAPIVRTDIEVRIPHDSAR